MAKFNAKLALQEVVDRTNRNRAKLLDELCLLLGEDVVNPNNTVTELMAVLRREITVLDLLSVKS